MLLGAPYLHNYATRTRQAASRDSVTPLQFNTNTGRFLARSRSLAGFYLAAAQCRQMLFECLPTSDWKTSGWTATTAINLKPSHFLTECSHSPTCLAVLVVCKRLNLAPTLNIILSDSRLHDTIHRESKKQDTKLLPITSPNVNRLSKFFYCLTQW